NNTQNSVLFANMKMKFLNSINNDLKSSVLISDANFESYIISISDANFELYMSLNDADLTIYL
ncbi:hypothetical protein FQN54_003093, partial [Arachnomyces sp. PD_36]